MSDGKRRLLLVEDDDNVARLYRRTFSRAEPPVDVEWQANLAGALEALGGNSTDLVLLDLNLPDSQGIATLDALRKNNHGIPIMVLTGLDDLTLMAECLEHGADMYLVKTHTPPEVLVQVVNTLLRTREAELQLLQAQRLEAVGRLAAGIAHEINTPAQFVQDNLTFLKEAVDDLRPLLAGYRRLLAWAAGKKKAAGLTARLQKLEQEVDAEYLIEEMPRACEQCLDGIQRIAKIVLAMKEFGHPGSKRRKPVAINHGLQNTLTVARNEYKYVAEVETNFGEIPAIPGYEAELNQVWLNLIVNAAHAIGEKFSGSDRRGVISIATRATADEVIVEIGDNGCGIPAANRARIFEPFFTTKEVGKGTGQGLALARSVIVDKHQGRIEVDSTPGEGTTFRIVLPREGGR